MAGSDRSARQGGYMKYYYTAVLTPREDGTGYDCSVPDIPHCVTGGTDLSDAVTMITDAATLMLTAYEDDGRAIPPATNPVDFPHEPGAITTLVALDTDAYRMRMDTAPVRKSVSIPAWMDKMARKRGISCSQVLQEALRQRLT